MLVVPVEPVCDVSIEVRVGHTYPMEGVDIRLTPSPTLTAMTSYGARLCSIVWRPQGDGSGPIKGVPAGVHALDVSELRSVPRRLEVAAAPPGTTQVLVILDPLPLLGDLAGLITYEAPLQGHGGVRIQNVSDPRLSYSVGAGDRCSVAAALAVHLLRGRRAQDRHLGDHAARAGAGPRGRQ